MRYQTVSLKTKPSFFELHFRSCVSHEGIWVNKTATQRTENKCEPSEQPIITPLDNCSNYDEEFLKFNQKKLHSYLGELGGKS